MNNKYDKNKTISANNQIEKLNHEKMHIEILLHQFKDLQIYQEEGGEITYYSSSINSQVDAVYFHNATYSGYNNLHYAYPYKEININCPHCEGIIKMNTLPNRFLVFIYYGSDFYTGEHYMYSAAYEDVAKNLKISQDIIGKCHIYTLNFLNTLSEKKIKLTERYLNSACEKLLPFM